MAAPKRPRYHYLKTRQGKHVLSLYLGKGPQGARALAQARAARSARRQAVLLDNQALKTRFAQLDDALDRLAVLTRALTRATLLARGFHTHRGQWRKKQHGKR